MKQSKQWKALEREAAKELRGRRVLRGADFAESDVDVVVDALPHLKIDAKYRVKHAHHSLLDEIRRKYCGQADDVPVLVTKSHRQRGAYATVPLEFLGVLLEVYRMAMVKPVERQTAPSAIPLFDRSPDEILLELERLGPRR